MEGGSGVNTSLEERTCPKLPPCVLRNRLSRYTTRPTTISNIPARPDSARNFIDALRWRRGEPGSDPHSAGRRTPL